MSKFLATEHGPYLKDSFHGFGDDVRAAVKDLDEQVGLSSGNKVDVYALADVPTVFTYETVDGFSLVPVVKLPPKKKVVKK